jgi:type IV pilus assembly protein PilX
MNRYRIPQRERGISLVIVLLFLVIMAGLGATAIRTATIEEKMSGNERDRQIAFEAAEAALRDGENDVLANLTTDSAFDDNCVGGLCNPASTATPQWVAVDWSTALPRAYGTQTGIPAGYPVTDVARAPRYIVEFLSGGMPVLPGCSAIAATRASCDGGTPFRITAVGWGRRASTQVMLQSVFVKTF